MKTVQFKNIMAGSTITAINAEIANQERLKASGKFERTCAEMADADNLTICAEEFGEVAEDLRAGDRAHMREELLQLIACLVRWYESDGQYPPQYDPQQTKTIVEQTIALGATARRLQETNAAA